VITIELQRETREVEEAADLMTCRVVSKLLFSIDTDPSYPYLRYIDPHGDTIFNTLQMKPFLEEWDRFSQMATTDSEREAMDKVKQMALKCRDSVGLYLKFIGD
jgi:hypothetical protein